MSLTVEPKINPPSVVGFFCYIIHQSSKLKVIIRVATACYGKVSADGGGTGIREANFLNINLKGTRCLRKTTCSLACTDLDPNSAAMFY